MEIHEDQPLVEPSAAWIRQIYVPVIAQADLGGSNNYPPYLGVGNVGCGIRRLPTDYTAMSQCNTALIPGVNGNVTMGFTLNAGGCDELWTVHTANGNFAYALVANTLTCVDLVALFPAFFAALVAGDWVRIDITKVVGAPAVRVYGLDMRYT